MSINSAIEVDLLGQVGAELARGVHIGAVGGQVDFSRAASLTGSRSIIALRSTTGAGDQRSESTIVPALRGGVVTTARVDVDAVVTEHGVAMLTGCTVAERALRLIEVAAPEHREALAAQPRRAGDVMSQTSSPTPSTGETRRVHVREVGPRDGFQNEPETIATADKIRLIDALGSGRLQTDRGGQLRPARRDPAALRRRRGAARHRRARTTWPGWC